MKMYVLMGCGLVLTLGVCASVIHFEAGQTRSALREIARDELPKGVRDGIDQSIDNTIDRVPKLGGSIVDKIQSTLEDTLDSTTGKPSKGGNSLPAAAGTAGKIAGDMLGRIRDTMGGTSGSGKESSTDSGAGDPKPGDKDSTSRRSGRPKDEAGAQPAEPRTAASVVDGLFDVVRGAAKAGDQIGQEMLKLSPAEEREWGQVFHDHLMSTKKIVRKPALTRRIERIAAPLVSARRRRAIDYTFTVIESKDDDINAFSTVGGYIYLHSALVDFTKNDQELQFVIGHEIGHVDLGHCGKRLAYTARASQLATPIAGQVAGILHALLLQPFAKEEEFEADAYGFKAVIAAGQTREQALSFPKRMGVWMIEHGYEEPSDGQPKKTVAGVLVRRAQDHFQTHPPMGERLQRLEAIDVGPHEKK